MNILSASSSSGSYNIYIEENLSSFFILLDSYKNCKSKLYVITDDKVRSLHMESFNKLENLYGAKIFNFANGEENKNINTINKIYDFLLENGANRDSVLIGIGGGVVGDIAAFAAATFMRGIKFINVPTTLVSQVDSCIGGKAGYNHNNIKNAIGCFHDPAFVYIATDFLETLEQNLILDGLGEIIKYGFIASRELLEFIDNNADNILKLDKKKIAYIIKECLYIKTEIIKKDYSDSNFRNVLNFGHTAGHGIEAVSEYKIHHGLAVALGMLISIRLSEKLTGLNNNIYQLAIDMYNKLGLPINYQVDNFSAFLYAISHDKKNTESINFVLLEDIGKPKTKVCVNESDIIWAVKNSIF